MKVKKGIIFLDKKISQEQAGESSNFTLNEPKVFYNVIDEKVEHLRSRD